MPDGLDPTISLQAGRNIPQFGPDMGQVLSLARLGMAVQQQQQQQQSLAALRQAYANPGNFVGGMPTMAAISQAGQQSPEAAMELQKFGAEGARTQYLQQQMEDARQALGLKSTKVAMDIKDQAQQAYLAAKNIQHLPEPEARAVGQRTYTDLFQDAHDSGIFSASQWSKISPNFDPVANQGHLDNYKKIQDILDAQKKEGREEAAFPTEQSLKQAQTAKAAAEAQLAPAKGWGPVQQIKVKTPDGKEKFVPARQDLAQPGAQAAFFDLQGNRIDPAKIVETKAPASLVERPQLSDEAANMFADQAITAGPAALRMGWGGAEIRTQIMNKLAEKATALWGKDAGANLATVGAMFESQEGALKGLAKLRGNVENFEGTALREANLALELAPKGLAGQAPAINRWIQAGRTSIKGDEDVSRLNAAVTSLTNEYARIMSSPGATGGTTSDHARAEAQGLLNNAMNADQFKGVIDIMKRSMANRVDAINDQMRTTVRDIQGGGGVSQPLGNPPSNPATAPSPTAATAQPTAKPPAELPKEGMVRVYPDGSAWSVQGGKPVQLRPPQGQ